MLQTRGDDASQTNMVIATQIHMDWLRYHHAARGEETATPGQVDPPSSDRPLLAVGLWQQPYLLAADTG